MTQKRLRRATNLVLNMHLPLIGVIFRHDNEEVASFFSVESEANAGLVRDATEDALSLAGAWSDLDTAHDADMARTKESE